MEQIVQKLDADALADQYDKVLTAGARVKAYLRQQNLETKAVLERHMLEIRIDYAGKIAALEAERDAKLGKALDEYDREANKLRALAQRMD